MAKTTAATAAEPVVCRCGCGAPVDRMFKQGHDQKLISKLAEDLVYGSVWDGKCMGILRGVSVRADIQERINLVEARIATGISESLAAKFVRAAQRAWELEKTKNDRAATKAERKAAKASKPAPKKAEPKAAKVAAHATAGTAELKLVKPTATNADVDAEEAAADGSGFGPGDSIRVKIGKRTRNAVVRGMNQAGKVTAVVLQNGDKEVVKTEGQFEVIN